MKKKMILALLCASLLTFTACGEEVNPPVDGNSGTSIEESDKGSDTSDEKESSTTTPSTYESFLQGNGVVYFDNSSLSYEQTANGSVAQFAPNTPYSFKQIMERVTELNSTSDSKVEVNNPRYCYIDCGSDGQKELAVAFSEDYSYGSFNQLMILKEIGDKLQFCYGLEYGYRSFAELNTAGVITYGGSNGAASYSNSYSYIDGNGTSHFSYQVDEEGSSFALAFLNPDKQYSGDLLSLTAYSMYTFEPMTDEMDYATWMRSNTFVYYMMDENYSPVYPAEIYTPGNSAYDMFQELGLHTVMPDEINAYVKEKRLASGLTDEMLNAPAVTWTDLNL